jgi:hypothetical protein
MEKKDYIYFRNNGYHKDKSIVNGACIMAILGNDKR